MKIIVIGLGSMGKRRIRLVKQINNDIQIIGIDSKANRRIEAEKLYNIQTTTGINEAIDQNKDISCAIISTSPLSHAGIIEDCLNYNLNVFTELNLVSDRYNKNIALADSKKLVLFLSSTFLYRDEVNYIQNKISKSKSPTNYSYHIGQYLPDWHPWENYKSFFVGNKKTNGCREIMAIEFPWLIKTFGPVKKFTVCAGRMSSLEIDYPDNYQLLIEHESGTRGALSVDIVSRKAVRNLEIYGEDLYLSWNGSPIGLQDYDFDKKELRNVNLYEDVDHQEGYSAFVIENAYKNELISFFNQVQRHSKAIYNFQDDLRTLELIDSIEGQVLI